MTYYQATRFTRDLDAVRGLELEDFFNEPEAALAIGWNGLTELGSKRAHELIKLQIIMQV